jgi:hypothetical protein
MGVLVQGGTGARRTTSSKHLFPFESKALQSSVYARFVPTAAALFLPPLCVFSALPAICTAICSEYTEGQEAGVRRSKLALCWRCLGSVRGLYCCVGRAVFLFKVCSNCSSSSSSATSRQLLQGEILCEIFLPFNWLIVDINCSGISKKLFSSIRIL